MAEFRIYFSVTDSGYITCPTEAEANAAYKLLTTTNCTVEELGHIVEWNDSEFVADEPARYNWVTH